LKCRQRQKVPLRGRALGSIGSDRSVTFWAPASGFIQGGSEIEKADVHNCNRFDARLFWSEGLLKTIFSSISTARDGTTWFQSVATLCVESGKLDDVVPLADARCQPAEKNWMPISDPQSPHPSFVYSVAPTQVVDLLSGLLRWREPRDGPEELRSARGGSQLVRISVDQFLCIVHHTKLWPVRHYTHRAVILSASEESLSVQSFSQEFFLRRPFSLEFATGLAVSDGDAKISFGFGERKLFFADIPVATLLSSRESRSPQPR
jgi:hypothetical protein